MRKKRSKNPVIQKSYEISRVQQVNWISAVLFGLLMPFYILSALMALDFLDIILALFFTVNFIISVRGIISLNHFKKRFMTDPDEYVHKPIKQPLIYRAVFWYLPK